MSQFTNLTAQFGFSRGRTVHASSRHRELGWSLGLEQGGKPTPLGNIDDLLLRNPAHRAKPVLGRGKTHHRVERFREHTATRTHNGEFMHGNARGQLRSE